MQSDSGAADSGLPPANFEEVMDVNERVQSGDLIYDAEDLEWYQPTRSMIGKYISCFTSVFRAKKEEAPTPTGPVSRRIKRTRRPVEKK